MGVLRVLLALAVAAEHANMPVGPGSYTAIQAFFIISGFYMAFILSEGKYSQSGFYRSRFFRLFPTYWFVLAVLIVYYGVAFGLGLSTTIFSTLREADLQWWQIVHLGLLNICIFFSDSLWFFPSLFGETHSIHYLAIPPVWSISLELIFYLLCPWLVTLKSPSLWVAAASLGLLRWGLYYGGANVNPWHARFLVFELMWFLLGILAFRIYQRNRREKWRDCRFVETILIVVLFMSCLFFQPLTKILEFPKIYGMVDYIPSLIFYGILWAALPALFRFSRHSKWDSYIGEFSYPIYLWHYGFVILIIHSGLASSWPINGAVIVLLLSFLHAAFTIHFVQKPIDAFRWSRYTRPFADHKEGKTIYAGA